MSSKSLRHGHSLFTIFILFITLLISRISSTSICCPATTSDDHNPLLYSRSPNAEPIAECHPNESKMWDFVRRDQEGDFESVDKRGEAEPFEKRENQEKRDDKEKESFDKRNGYVPNGCSRQPICCDQTPPIVCGKVPLFNGPSCDEVPIIVGEAPIIVDDTPCACDDTPFICDDICGETPFICDDAPFICDDAPYICDDAPFVCEEKPVCAEQLCGGFNIGSIRIRPGVAPLGWSRFGI